MVRSEINQDYLDPRYLASVQAVEEAVVNALVAGEDAPTIKPAGKTVMAIDTARLASMFQD